MTSAASVEGFVGQKKLAIVGASRSGEKMGNVILNELTAKGYTVYPVHPEANRIGEQTAYRSLQELPEPVGGVVISVKPERTAEIIRDAHEAGITRAWIQQGAQTDDALAACDRYGMDAVSGECILMFAEPVQSIHRFHRFFRRVFGRMPA